MASEVRPCDPRGGDGDGRLQLRRGEDRPRLLEICHVIDKFIGLDQLTLYGKS